MHLLVCHKQIKCLISIYCLRYVFFSKVLCFTNISECLKYCKSSRWFGTIRNCWSEYCLYCWVSRLGRYNILLLLCLQTAKAACQSQQFFWSTQKSLSGLSLHLFLPSHNFCMFTLSYIWFQETGPKCHVCIIN